MTDERASLAQLAADEFDRRRSAAARKVAEGALARPAAEAALRPWLALAIRAGSDISGLSPDAARELERLRTERREDGQPCFPEWTARAIVADDICARPAMIEALASARDAALVRAEQRGAEQALLDRARVLDTLAYAFGAPANGTRPSTAVGDHQ